jgi:hypothetical protein
MPTSLLSRATQTSGVVSRLGQGALAAYAVSLAVLCGLLVINGPQIRAAAEAEEARVIEEENRAFCSEFGIEPTTSRFAKCAASLMDIRGRHLQRSGSDSIL